MSHADEATFLVNDMTCGHCVQTVRKALETAFPGAPVSVDLGTHRVSVAGDRQRAETAIREAGYTPEAA